MNHELKILLNHYERVKAGTKTFEIRKNDRYFQKGDSVELKCFDEKTRSLFKEEVYPNITAKIGDIYTIENDFVVFSLLEVK